MLRQIWAGTMFTFLLVRTLVVMIRQKGMSRIVNYWSTIDIPSRFRSVDIIYELYIYIYLRSSFFKTDLYAF